PPNSLLKSYVKPRPRVALTPVSRSLTVTPPELTDGIVFHKNSPTRAIPPKFEPNGIEPIAEISSPDTLKSAVATTGLAMSTWLLPRSTYPASTAKLGVTRKPPNIRNAESVSFLDSVQLEGRPNAAHDEGG